MEVEREGWRYRGLTRVKRDEWRYRGINGGTEGSMEVQRD